MPETKRVLWVDQQASELLRYFRACVERRCVDRGVDLNFDFTLAKSVQEGVILAGQPFDALILEIVLPKDEPRIIELRVIQSRRDRIKSQIGLKRLNSLLEGKGFSTLIEEDLLSRFIYLGEKHGECLDFFGGFKVLEKWRKNLPAIIFTTQSLKDSEMAKQFLNCEPERWRWFEKPCLLEEVAGVLVELFK